MANQQVGSESGYSRSRRQPTSKSNFQVPLVKENEDTYLNDYFVEAPGSLPGELKIPSDAYYPQIFLINYSETEATRTQIASLENCQEYLDDLDTVTWIDIQGLGSEEVLRQMGQIFNLNHLLLEDIVNAMNFLTIVLSIYTPLAFITGLYGMNFNPKRSPWNMPELNWYWGYPMALAIMGLSAMAMIIFFWRSGWFVPFKTFIKVLGTQNKKSGSC